MRHRAFAPALCLVAISMFATGSPSEASAADPSGIWANDDGSAKVEIKKCGRGICSKVVWLKHSKDSQGKPLHDVRNEDSSMRDRPIIGLPLFRNMTSDGTQHLGGECLQSRRGSHLYGRQGDARLATANRAQRLQGVAPLRGEDVDQIATSAQPGRSGGAHRGQGTC